MEFGFLCELQEDKPDSAQWTPVEDKGGLDTLGVETEGLGQPVPKIQSISLILEVRIFAQDVYYQ